MNELELVPTRELVCELQRRFDSLFMVGLTINDGTLTYHQVSSGKNNWAFASVFLGEIDNIKAQMSHAPPSTNSPFDWGE